MFFSLYFVSSFFLFSMSVLSFIGGLFLMSLNYSLMVDWEILSINSCLLSFTLILDYISMLFMSCVLFISSMVVFYSYSYMGSDFNKNRFLILVLLFIFSMMMVILSPNMVSILLGWDGLGLVSYCLVIYFQNYKSYSAGMLTILINRIGDVAILMSICWMLNFGCWNFIYYMLVVDWWSFYLLLLVVLASFTKSAQIPFSSWLPAAMAAPTPVSALVHSSTLVTAGVYLSIRFYSLISVYDCWFFSVVGLLTMFMSGLCAMFEYDLKKVIALSTLSQLGMMFGILFLGFPMLAFFHLLTHAFFKALIFLCAGLIIHVMSDSQDIRYMGSSIVYLPCTCACFCISNLSLCGFPFLSGFYSKDIILECLTINSYNLFYYLLFFVSVGLTVAYSFRLVFYCISGGRGLMVCQNYAEDVFMCFPMMILTFMAVFFGSLLSWLLFPAPMFVVLPIFLKLLPLIFVLLGMIVGYEISSLTLSDNLLVMKNYFISCFLGSMWFMPFLSTSLIYPSGFSFSERLSTNMDSGWGEYMISDCSYSYFVFYSKLNSYVQNNNLKLIMISFLLITIIFLI